MCRKQIGRWLRRLGLREGPGDMRGPLAPPLPRPVDVSLPSIRDAFRRVADRLSVLGQAAWQALTQAARGLRARVVAGASGVRLPLIQRYTDWLQRQQPIVQTGLLAWMAALAAALAILAVSLWMNPTILAKSALPESVVQTHDLSEMLYGWLEEEPKPPKADDCGPFETSAQCQRRLASQAEAFQVKFWAYAHQQTEMTQSAVWVKAGDAFPAYSAAAGLFEFPFQMEGTPQGDPKTCIPLRVIASMPPGIVTKAWPDQQGPDAPANPFPHPCLRCTEWTARVGADADTAKRWIEAAKADGWRLEMTFRLQEWESPIRDEWDRDACLAADDFVGERRIWLWVDEVRLVVGDEVAHRWR